MSSMKIKQQTGAASDLEVMVDIEEPAETEGSQEPKSGGDIAPQSQK